MANKKTQFYFETDGSYNEKHTTTPKGQTPDEKSWWNQLSEGHRAVIIWHTDTFGRDHAPYLKGPEQHDFAYSHFESFKRF